MVKNLPGMRQTGSSLLVGKIPWRREWQPTPVFLPGEFHGVASRQATVHGVAESDITCSLVFLFCVYLKNPFGLSVEGYTQFLNNWYVFRYHSLILFSYF